MPQFINSNIPSLTAQRNLNTSQNSLNTSLQRLSSGLRINSAKDDAAGLAISERFTTQIRGLNQAARNANDGISLAQTAEGDLGAITNNLQRIRELSVQSANATNSASDRVALQAEVSELISEIDRVASTSAFNGVKLLNGSFSAQQFQVGANAGETVTISSIASSRTTAIGQANTATATGTKVTAALATNDLLINGVDVGAVANPGDSGSLAANIAAAITAADSQVTAAVGQSEFAVGAFATVSDLAANDDGVYTLTVEGIDVIDVTDLGVAGNTVTAAEVDTALGLTATTDLLTAAGVSFTGTAAGSDLVFIKADGSNLNLTETRTVGTGANAALAGNGFANLGATTATGSAEEFGKLTLTSQSAILVAGNTPGNAGLTAGTSGLVLSGTTISTTNISTVAGANAAISSVDNALTTINSSRAQLGAVQNRFDSVVSSIQTTSENLSASRSRIRDADFAAETAQLTRAQILQQAGVSILGQANSLPQNALSLLQ